MKRTTVAVTVLAAVIVATSAIALPLIGGGIGGSEDAPSDRDVVDPPSDGDAETALTEGEPQSDRGSSPSETGPESTSSDSTSEPAASPSPSESGAEARDLGLVSMEPTTASTTNDGTAAPTLSQEQEDAVETGVEEGIDLVQAQGVEVTQEQRAAAIEGARESAAQHQEASVEQVQQATAGAVHGALIQEQRVEAEQVQSAIGGATDGALAQYQTVEASQMQAATWGATHGAIAQKQRVTVEQLQVATRGAAAGAASEAGDKDVQQKPKIQEAAQGAAYGVLDQYQKITVEQRQRITLEHVQNAAAGGSAGALEGSTRAVIEQEQQIDIEQRQRVTIKQVQKAAKGASSGALVQKQEVTVEQTQAAARGAGRGPLKQVQTIRIEQIQRITITQIQEASFGAAKGSIYQSQEATVEQIQAAADGASQGVLVQRQEISIAQVQYAAVGASTGAIESAVQRQIVEVEQIQAAARGAGEGAVIQRQVVDVTQVQKLAEGSAGGALVQYQEATIEQTQIAARSACQETARVVQFQRISVTQLQVLSQETAAETAAFAVEEEIEDETELQQVAASEASEGIEEIDELEGTATTRVTDQESDGERVVVDDVELSEGGFVAVYDDVDLDPNAVLGVSGYLDAGEHESVEIELDDPIESNQSVVVAVHHDTTGDQTFDYAETDGEEDQPYITPGGSPVLDTAVVEVEAEVEEEPTLSVSDQEGDGETLTIDEASAPDEYTLTAEYDGEQVESEEFEANETVEEFDLELDPLIEENTTVEIAVVGPEGDQLENESIEYTVEEDVPEATLSVSDQTGDGETLTIENASAETEYTITADYDDAQVESEPFEANETIEEFDLGLDPPIEENTTVEVAVVSDGGEDGQLANATIEYTVEDEPEATLSVFDQEGDGETLTVDEANASVDYALTVTDDDGEQRGESSTFEAGETIENESIGLDPPLEADAPLNVSVVATEDDQVPDEAAQVLATETIEYTVDEPEPFDVEFVDCSQAEVTGTFENGDTIVVETGFYESGESGPLQAEYELTVGEDVDAPLEGPIEYEVTETVDELTVTETAEGTTVEIPSGDFGTAITGFASPDATPDEIDYPNPDAEECIADVRPELPEIGVEETTPIDDGDAIEVTFGYENPNDAPLLVESEFTEGTTEDEPIEELEPGDGTFTVVWTPADDSERLVWAVDMTTYDYEEVRTAETATAGEIAPSEPAEFTVSDLSAPETAEPGETVTVTATIENEGELEDEQLVTYSIDGQLVAETEVSLGGGESVEIPFSVSLPEGESTHAVATETDEASVTITAEPPAADEEETDPIDDLFGDPDGEDPFGGLSGIGAT